MTKKELVIVAIISLITVALALSPVIYGYLQTPRGYQFSAFGRDDEYANLAWVKQGQQGKLLFKNLYSVEAKENLLFTPLFLVMGKISWFFGKNLFLTFNLARVFCGLLLLITAYVFFSFFFKDFLSRAASLLLLAFSSGLGFLLFFIPKKQAPFLFESIIVPEALTFPTILFAPHFGFALTMMILSFLFFLKFSKEGRLRGIILFSIFGNLLIFIHPYDTLTLILTPILYLFLLKGIGKKELIRGCLCLFSLAPSSFYIALLSQIDPIYKQFMQSFLPRLTLLGFLSIYGLLLPLVLLGVRQVSLTRDQQEKERILFVFAWLGTTLFLLILPLNFQRKMIMGFQIPLSVLAIYGLKTLWQKIQSIRSSWLILLLFFPIFFLQNFYLLNREINNLRENSKVYYLSFQLLQAQKWLEENLGDEEVVLANPAIGLITPPLSGKKAILGYPGNTNLFVEKAEELWDFFSPQETEEERRQFVSQYNLAYYYKDKEGISHNLTIFPVEIFRGKKIQELEKEFKADGIDYLEKVFENEAAAIYKIRKYTHLP